MKDEINGSKKSMERSIVGNKWIRFKINTNAYSGVMKK